MSWYYTYFIGEKRPDGKIYPLGPYNAAGKLKDVMSISASFASDIHYRFRSIGEKEVSEELRKEFEYEDYKGEKHLDVKWLPESDLPEGSFIRSGYFLQSDVLAYQTNPENFEGFYEVLTPEVYAAKLQAEMRFGPPREKKDEDGDDITPPSASEYMYFAYPDYDSEEYEAHIFRKAIDSLSASTWDPKADVQDGVLLVEG